MWEKTQALYFAYRWQVWAVVAAAVGVGAMLLRNLLLKPGPEHSGPNTYLPEPPEALVRKVEETERAALVARARAKAKFNADREELDRVAAIDDGAERRKRLAELIERL